MLSAPCWVADDIDAETFREMFTDYLGVESRGLLDYHGRSIPCGAIAGGRVCDPYGVALGLATLPGGDQTDLHDTLGAELLDIMHEAGYRAELEPRGLFTSLIPVAVLMADGAPPGVVPDAAMDVALPPVGSTARVRGRRHCSYGDARPAALPRRRLLFDVKTIMAGGPTYRSARARDQQCGAVMEREHHQVSHQVGPAYRRHAEQLDRAYSAAGRTPIADRLASFTEVRALVFGNYGELSCDCHALLELAATATARKRWGLMAARTMVEARGYIIQRLRQRMGIVCAREFARYRLRRVAYCGVQRAALVQRMQRGMPGLGGGGARAHVWRADHFLADQAVAHRGDVRVGMGR